MQWGLLVLLPQEVAPILIAVAGFCFMIGAKRIAVGLLTFSAGCIFLPVLLLPLVEALPIWLVWLILAYLVFLLPFIAIVILGALVRPAIGQNAADHMVGDMAAKCIKWMLLFPFLLLGLIVRLIWRR